MRFFNLLILSFICISSINADDPIYSIYLYPENIKLNDNIDYSNLSLVGIRFSVGDTRSYSSSRSNEARFRV